jgi:F-type H+-transporting ATPase subunit b
MKEAIDEVLAAEKEAAALLEQARHRADEIRHAAEAAAADEAKAARDRSAERVRAALERAEEQAAESFRAAVAAAEAEGEAALASNRTGMGALVEQLVQLIAAPRHVDGPGRPQAPGSSRKA